MTDNYALFCSMRSSPDKDMAERFWRYNGYQCLLTLIDPWPAISYLHFMQTADVISKKLADALAPQSLNVVDESHQHEGHAGHRPGGQTHFRVYIVSEAFTGKTRIDRHRMINAILSDELAAGVHALAIHAQAPSEAKV